MDNNALENLKSMLSGTNIPSDLQNVLSNMASSNNNSSNQDNKISPEAINKLASMINSKSDKRLLQLFT